MVDSASDSEARRKPFLYAHIDRRMLSDCSFVFAGYINCANQGYGHRQDPTLAVFRDFKSEEEIMKAIDDYCESENIVVAKRPSEYVKALIDAGADVKS